LAAQIGARSSSRRARLSTRSARKQPDADLTARTNLVPRAAWNSCRWHHRNSPGTGGLNFLSAGIYMVGPMCWLV